MKPKHEKVIFIALCMIMLFINAYLVNRSKSFSIAEFIGGGLGISLLAIPLWASIGVILANIGLFFYKIAKPDQGEVLSIWQKMSVGLIAGIILESAFGIFVK